MNISRADPLILPKEKLQNICLQRHCLTVEAIMRGLALYFSEDLELWSITGLMHDIDYKLTKDDVTKHGLLSAGWLAEKIPRACG